ncbi:MAG TPA: hypothetical protein VHC46_01875 [Thermodesulfobacteriota bacterium]|nr:hypothetical protein [Thermodesulfobacteriota bacterium]
MGLNYGQSCYNYTFIDNRSIRGTLLEQEKMDSLPDKPDSISYDTVRNYCKPNNARQLAAIEKAGSQDSVIEDSEASNDTPMLLNPGVKFIDEDKLSFEQIQSKQTIFYGGLVPFVAVHDADLETNDHFINPQSVSLFLYFKRKF